ncbi:MAG: hypothetical protein KAH09_05900, partial [Desulfobacula sp.]|nr:hypothetical protein [Desulfobacula sp.]
SRKVVNMGYIMSANWAGPDNGCTAFCPPFIDEETYKLEKLGKAPGVLSGIVDTRYLEEVRRRRPYLTDRNVDMYGADD